MLKFFEDTHGCAFPVSRIVRILPEKAHNLQAGFLAVELTDSSARSGTSTVVVEFRTVPDFVRALGGELVKSSALAASAYEGTGPISEN